MARVRFTELERIDYLTREVKRHYPSISVHFNHRKKRFQLIEETIKGSAPFFRRLWDYENIDGTKFPCLASRVVDWLHKANTQHWPLELRMAAFDKQDAEERASNKRAFDAMVADKIMEDYHYIAGIPTFFFGPDMPVGRATFTPAQQRMLKSAQIL